jgi:phosphoglycolate phosphatase
MTRGCVIFDLDGTLIDSREDLATGVNLMRGDFGLAPLPLSTVVGYVGDGVHKLCERALKDTGIVLEDALPHMRRHYCEHLLDRTVLYPGAAEGLETLRQAGFELAVVTNKPEGPSNTILNGLGVADRFRFIIGGGSKFQLKPDPQALLHIMNETGVAPDRTWMVGDHYTDLESGRRAGAIRVFAGWGFGDPRNEIWDVKADTFADLVRMVLEK